MLGLFGIVRILIKVVGEELNFMIYLFPVTCLSKLVATTSDYTSDPDKKEEVWPIYLYLVA